MNIEGSSSSSTEEMTISATGKEESIEESSKKSSFNYKSTKKNKKTNKLKMQASEDPFLTITEAVGSTTNNEIKDYKDKISHLTKMHKIKRNADYHNNLFQLALDRMDFELASHLIANFNITKIDSFLEFIKKEANNENFINHPQFEYLVEIFNTAIEKNIFNEVNLMGIMRQRKLFKPDSKRVEFGIIPAGDKTMGYPSNMTFEQLHAFGFSVCIDEPNKAEHRVYPQLSCRFLCPTCEIWVSKIINGQCEPCRIGKKPRVAKMQFDKLYKCCSTINCTSMTKAYDVLKEFGVSFNQSEDGFGEGRRAAQQPEPDQR